MKETKEKKRRRPGAGRPIIYNERRKIVNIRLPVELWLRVRARARRDHTSLTKVARRLFELYTES